MKRRDILYGISGATLTGLAGCIGTNPLTKEGAETAEESPKSTPSSKSGDEESTTGAQNTAGETGLRVGQKLPNFTLQTTTGGEVSLHPVQKPTVLFFMAAWCTSCKQEESNLKQMFQQYGDDIRIITIEMDPERDTMEDLRQFKQQYGGDWIHAMGTQNLIQEYRLTSLDTTYIINQSGVTIYKDSDVTSVKTFERELEELL